MVKQFYQDHVTQGRERIKEERRELLLKKRYLETLAKKQNRKHILDVLEAESKEWISNKDSNTVLDHTVIPNVYYTQSDYYLKLQEVS